MVWTVIDRLLTIMKWDLFDKIKWEIFQEVTFLVLLYGCTTKALMKCMDKKAKWELHKNAAVLNKPLKHHLKKTAAVCPLTAYLPNHPIKHAEHSW